MTVQRFEDLICWQKARGLTSIIHGLTKSPEFGKDADLVRRIRQAATTVMSNIAEGFERWNRKEFVRFLELARGAAGEVRSQLYVALDQQYITGEQFELAKAAVEETSTALGGLIGYLERHARTHTGHEPAPEVEVSFNIPAGFFNPTSGPAISAGT
jgi:four helix bundle protein